MTNSVGGQIGLGRRVQRVVDGTGGASVRTGFRLGVPLAVSPALVIDIVRAHGEHDLGIHRWSTSERATSWPGAHHRAERHPIIARHRPIDQKFIPAHLFDSAKPLAIDAKDGQAHGDVVGAGAARFQNPTVIGRLLSLSHPHHSTARPASAIPDTSG